MLLLSRLFRQTTLRNTRRVRTPFVRRRAQPTLECLESRLTPSTASSITGSFNGTAIPAGSTIWFDAAFQAGNLPKSTTVTVHIVNAAIDFNVGTTPYHVTVPNADIVLTPGATSASTSFDPTDNDWDVSAPTGGAGDVFMGGVVMQVPSRLPGGIKNVTWSVNFWSDTAGITVNWKWAAAVYKSFSTDNTTLGVKPVDNNTLSVYKSGDQSGTPEAFKSLVIAGALGNGGNNYTGNFTGGKSVTPTLGDGAQDYPYPSSNPLTSVAFNESTVVKGATLDLVNGAFEVWYSDEHALAHGVSQVNVKTSSGTTTTNYPVASLTSDPNVAVNPCIGTTCMTGDQAGVDASGRSMAPSLYITDSTNNPTSCCGDWQWGGTAYAPSAVFGTWKSFTRTVDHTTSTPTITLTAAADPAQNGWNLGSGADAVPTGLTNEGYGAEVRWNLSALQVINPATGVASPLIPGHTYRFYVIIHDGDQNKAGGDAGQASFDYSYAGPATPSVTPTTSLSGNVLNGTQGGAIAGVTINLAEFVNGAWMNVATTTTGADGSYSFTGLQAGTYQITQTPPLPSGFTFESTTSTTGTVGGTADGFASGDVIGSINVNAGDNGINYNFTDYFGSLLGG